MEQLFQYILIQIIVLNKSKSLLSYKKLSKLQAL